MGIPVILLTRLNGPVFALNPDLVERADCTPDTVITLIDGTKYLVAESLPELVALIRQYRALVVAEAQNLTGQPADDVETVAVPPGARPNGASASSGASAAEADAGNVFHLHRREH
jgi:flagellar protein FlbD